MKQKGPKPSKKSDKTAAPKTTNSKKKAIDSAYDKGKTPYGLAKKNYVAELLSYFIEESGNCWASFMNMYCM